MMPSSWLRSGRATRLFRFGATGILSNLFLLGVFAVLVRLGVGAMTTTVLVYAIGVSITYLVNRNWSFSSDRPHARTGPGYVATQVLGLGVQLSMQWIFHEHFHMPALAVQVVAIPVVALLSFVILERIVFHRSPLQ